MSTEMLDRIQTDFRSTLVVARWIEFLKERVPIDRIPRLFEFYARIGWISNEARHWLTNILLGISPDDELYDDLRTDPLVPAASESGMWDRTPGFMENMSISESEEKLDWRLSLDDHLKSYMFIQELSGNEIDRDEWNAIELRIEQLKNGLREVYGV